jgi:TonB family protein
MSLALLLVLPLLIVSPLDEPTRVPDEAPPVSARKRTDEDRAALSGNFDVPPRIKKQTKPLYPDRAFKERLEAEIHVEFVVDEQGRARDPEVHKMTEPPAGTPGAVADLYEAALEAVRQWRFEPATKDGQPVATIALSPVTFTIYGPKR